MHQGMLTDKGMLALRVDLDDKLPPPLSKTFDQIRVALGGRNEGIHQGSKDSLLGILPRGQNQAGSVGAPLNHVDTIMMRIVEEGYKVPSTEVTLSASQVLEERLGCTLQGLGASYIDFPQNLARLPS